MRIDWLKLIGSIILCQMAGVFGSVFTISAIPTWYATLTRPFFAPPNWLFGPAWITLYTLMGIALYLILSLDWKKYEVRRALGVFSVQLALNALWSLLFFGLRSPIYGLLCIMAMLGFILLTIINFYRLDRRAGLLLVPYIAWVSFATTLNAAIWLLNP